MSLQAVFGDRMVLQRDMPLPVWGWAAPGEKVRFSVGENHAAVVANAGGKWMVSLSPLDLIEGSISMIVSGDSPIVLEDLLIGDVWLCSGQSNMEFGIGNVANAKGEIAAADDRLIRMFDVSHAPLVAFEPQGDTSGRWVSHNPKDIREVGNWKGFSAVGYYFGRELRDSVGVPIGLICSAVWAGGRQRSRGRV